MSLFRRRNLKPPIYARTRQTDVLRSLVAKGYGYSIANVRPVNRMALDGSALAYVPLRNPFPTLTLGIIRLKALKTTRAIDLFRSHCKDRVSDDAIPGMR